MHYKLLLLSVKVYFCIDMDEAVLTKDMHSSRFLLWQVTGPKRAICQEKWTFPLFFPFIFLSIYYAPFAIFEKFRYTLLEKKVTVVQICIFIAETVFLFVAIEYGSKLYTDGELQLVSCRCCCGQNTTILALTVFEAGLNPYGGHRINTVSEAWKADHTLTVGALS